jgi:hypothetical protein
VAVIVQVPLVATDVTTPVEEFTVQMLVSTLEYVTARPEGSLSDASSAVATTVVVPAAPPPAASGVAEVPQTIRWGTIVPVVKNFHSPAVVTPKSVE